MEKAEQLLVFSFGIYFEEKKTTCKFMFTPPKPLINVFVLVVTFSLIKI